MSADQIRLFLHVLCAAVWVGGQIVLGGLVGPLRRTGADALRAAAQAFGRVAWPAYLGLFATGMWNALAVDIGNWSGRQKAWFGVKMTAWLVSGLGAALHSLVPRTWARAVGGAAASLGAVIALFAATGLHYPG